MSEVDDLLSLKKRVERLRRDSDKAQGALGRVKEQLQEEFKCASLKEARSLLRKLERQEKQQRKQLARALEKFEARYGKLL